MSEAAYGEEDAFRRTLDKGTDILDVAVSKAKAHAAAEEKAGNKDARPVVSGSEAFKLHDTYGFPIELTLEMAEEKGVAVDEKEFRRLMAEQKSRARQDAIAKRHNVDVSVYDDFRKTLSKPFAFLGYTQSSARARVLGLITDKGLVSAVSAPADVEVVLDQSPFYAERGGQQADHGEILSDDGAALEVDDVQEVVKGLTVHRCRLTDGTLSRGDSVVATIDTDRRAALARSHTATHTLHRALREILGPQATQRGSVVAPDFLHFDFQWPQAPSRQELDQVEELVNEKAMEDLPVVAKEMPIAEAEKLGAMHLFGSKYGDIVRVVTIGDGWSRELCGGTHLDRTGKIGNFVITAEMSNGSGVRRIDALMGNKGYEFNHTEHALVSALAGDLNVSSDKLRDRVSALLDQLRSVQQKLADVHEAELKESVPQIVKSATSVAGVRLAEKNIGTFGDVSGVREAVTAIRSLLGEDDPVVVALAGSSDEGRPLIFVATNKAARAQGIKAGDLVRLASKVLGGGGGGRPDFAQGGGKDQSKVDEALASIVDQLGR